MVNSEVIYAEEEDGVFKGSIRIANSSVNRVLYVGISSALVTAPNGDQEYATGILGSGFVTPDQEYKEMGESTQRSVVLVSTLFAISKKLEEKRQQLAEVESEVKDLKLIRQELAELTFESFDDDRGVLGIVDLCLGD